MWNKATELRALALGGAVGFITLLGHAVMQEPVTIAERALTPNGTLATHEDESCETAKQEPVITHYSTKDFGAPRDLNALLETGLTEKERRWLSDQSQAYITNELIHNNELTEQVIEEVMTLNNTATRRYLIQSLEVLEDIALEDAVYRLAMSDRALDQEAAIQLVHSSKSKDQKAYLIGDLLSRDLYENTQLNLIYSLRDSVSLPYMQDIHWQLQEIYRTSSNDNIKNAIINTITPKDNIEDIQFFEIFSLIENDSTKNETERLQAIKTWIVAYAGTFSEAQKSAIKSFTEILFNQSDNISHKKIALIIEKHM